MEIHRVIEKPLVTEKSTEMLQEGNWVSFRVSLNANKIQIKEAIEKQFSVTVLKVNTGIVRGKRRRFGRTLGIGKNWKKAMLRLKDGDKIEIFEGV